MTAATWLLLPLLAAAGYLTWLAGEAFHPDQQLNRRPVPLPDERPPWATDPRMAAPLGIYPHQATHAGNFARPAPLLTYLWEAEATNPQGWPTEIDHPR